MSGYFEISASWPEPSERQADVAEISIRLGDEILTRIADLESNTNREYFRASAVSLSLWFADNWWRLRCEPVDNTSLPSVDWRMRHELSAASGGTQWPPVMIYSGGDRVTFAPSLSRQHAAAKLRYLDTRVRTIQASQFEVGIDNFFNLVLESCAHSNDAPVLRELVDQLVVERKEPELTAWRRLEACLGYDADEAPSEVVERFLAISDRLNERDLEEAAIAAQGAHSADILESAIAASEASDVVLDFKLAERVDLSKTELAYPSPWQLAELAASQLRDGFGLHSAPISDKSLSDLLLARWDDLKATTETGRNLPYATRLRTTQSKQKVTLISTRTDAVRFEVSRLLGDAIWTDESAFGPISSAKSDRQKFQRAFAQSFLCPLRGVREFVDFDNPKSEDIRACAEAFHVHPHVVRNLLVYKYVLPPETLDDQLEVA
ncbi:MAG: hypothetical protein ACJ8ER_07225 [Allosphingosinicella sp.]